MRYHSAVASVGLAGGNKLETTVIPFIIRGVSLLGIDSVMCPPERRRAAWARLVRDLPMDKLDAMTESATLADLPRLAGEIIAGRVRGRLVIDVNA
jgi:acrylyl-CoA reductase (NADPH)